MTNDTKNQNNPPASVSRRRFVRGAATAGAGLAATAATAGAVGSVTAQGIGIGNDAPVTVAATIVRASHDPAMPGMLKVGVRASIVGPGITADGVVLVVDGVRFGQSPAELGRHVSESVREQVVALVRRRQQTVEFRDVSVQVFGGAL